MHTTASAPGKIIVCGEHAVVYHRPAIALPLTNVRATATIRVGTEGIVCDAPDIGERWSLAEHPDHPLARLVQAMLSRLGFTHVPPLRIVLRSDIPIASGMGSGAALGAALVRALAAHLGHDLLATDIAALVYESERLYHGTPSGIDNTVVSYEQPIWFVRSEDGVAPTIEALDLGAPLNIVIGDTGVRAPTYMTVGAVRKRWQRDPIRYEALFDQVGEVALAVRSALALGHIHTLGDLLNHNQLLLREIGVSSTELEQLIDAARAAGALGAKLSGGGGGGIMLALVDAHTTTAVQDALRMAGAVRVLSATVTAS